MKLISVRVLVGRMLVVRMFVVRRVALHWMIRSLGVVKSRLVMVSAVSLVVGMLDFELSLLQVTMVV